MASYIRKLFEDTKPLQKQETYNSFVDDYDATYMLINKILRILCLDIQDDRRKRAFWNVNGIFWFLMLNMILCTVLESLSIIMTANGSTMIELFTMMPCVGYLLVAISKAYKIKRFKHIYQNLVNELRTMWPVGQITEEEHQIIADNLKGLRFVVRAYYTCNMILNCIFVGPTCISVIRVWAGHEKGERSLPFFFWFPFDPLQDIVYEIVVVVQIIYCLISVLFMLSGDLLFCIFISHITTQFELLTVRINKMINVKIDNQLPESYPLGTYMKENLKNNTGQIVNNDESVENLEKILSEINQRHLAIIRLSKDVENMYSFSLLVNFMNSSIIICFCLFCVAFVEKWNEFNYKIFFLTSIYQIWLLCWYGQKLLDTSAGIADALYNCGWYMLSNKIKKCILIMIHRSQQRVYITTFGFSIVSMESYSKILQTSWSYFTLLINMYKG